MKTSINLKNMRVLSLASVVYQSIDKFSFGLN